MTRVWSKALAACLLAALLCFGETPARTEVRQEELGDTARTPAGELSIVRRRGPDEAVTIVVKLGERVLAEKEAGYRDASIYGTYPAQSPRYALLSLSDGSLTCGAKFAVVDLPGGKVSGDFGNCSDAPRVNYRRGSLTIVFPNGPGKHDPGTHYVGPGQVWTYGNGRLQKAGGRR